MVLDTLLLCFCKKMESLKYKTFILIWIRDRDDKIKAQNLKITIFGGCYNKMFCIYNKIMSILSICKSLKINLREYDKHTALKVATQIITLIVNVNLLYRLFVSKVHYTFSFIYSTIYTVQYIYIQYKTEHFHRSKIHKKNRRVSALF